jgi:tetratricopeptide (TPR) repeat protein
VEAARDASALNPLSPEPLWAEAAAEAARGNERRARDLYVEAAELQPRNPTGWYLLGSYEYTVLRDPQAALPHLEKLGELDPFGSGGELLREVRAAAAG